MTVAPPSTSLMPPSHDDPEHWEIKSLGWRSLFTDRLLWLAIGVSLAAHVVFLAPRYGIKLPQRGDNALLVSFRAANQSIAPSTPNQTSPAQSERRRAETAARAIPPNATVLTTAALRRSSTSTASTPASGASLGNPATGNRRVTLTPGMKDYRYSQYLDDWRRKVERVGAMNYPEEARGKFFGSLVLSVALRPDGSVDRIVVVRSSGNPVLDDAAKRIVTFAAPFAPFPPDIRQETDYLDITRTWTFTRTNALETR